MATDRKDCDDCGKSFKMCSCDHVFPYEGPAGSTCRRCTIYQSFVNMGFPSPNTWDGKSTCRQIRRSVLARRILANRRMVRENAFRDEFMSSHSEGHYWLIFDHAGASRAPFVAYLNADGYFTSHPDPDVTDEDRHYWRSVEVLCKCEVPAHVQARADAEFVMYS